MYFNKLLFEFNILVIIIFIFIVNLFIISKIIKYLKNNNENNKDSNNENNKDSINIIQLKTDISKLGTDISKLKTDINNLNNLYNILFDKIKILTNNQNCDNLDILQNNNAISLNINKMKIINDKIYKLASFVPHDVLYNKCNTELMKNIMKKYNIINKSSLTYYHLIMVFIGSNYAIYENTINNYNTFHDYLLDTYKTGVFTKFGQYLETHITNDELELYFNDNFDIEFE